LQIDGARQQLEFQRDLSDWQRRMFGSALEQRNMLRGSRFGGWSPYSWMFGNGANPIMPYTGGR
jgi:hypothetical protein